MIEKDLDKQFQEAVEIASSMTQASLPQDVQLRLYAFYKHATPNVATDRPTEFPGVMDTDLTALTRPQRLGFEISVGILCILSLCGNLSTLYVNSRRKMRPFFRTCLISLALSDLLSTIFLTLTHFPQFMAEYVQIWVSFC